MWSAFLLLVRNTGCEVAVSPGCLVLMTHSLPCRVFVTFLGSSECQSSALPQQPLACVITNISPLLLCRRCCIASLILSLNLLCTLQHNVAMPCLQPSQILLQIQDFLENPQMQGVKTKPSVFLCCQMLKEWVPLANTQHYNHFECTKWEILMQGPWQLRVAGAATIPLSAAH